MSRPTYIKDFRAYFERFYVPVQIFMTECFNRGKIILHFIKYKNNNIGY